MVTFTVSDQCAANLAELVRHELSVNRHASVLHLRLDDQGDQRDELVAAANALDA